jgi:hypothetical protein
MNKTIEINPTLFSYNSSKTRKKDKKPKKPNSINPVISSNVLKNKFLNRIKQFKQKEISNLNDNKLSHKSDIINRESKEKYSDEFQDSLDYLTSLSKQNAINQKQINKMNMEKKTMKNYNNIYSNATVVPQSDIQIELPKELGNNLENNIIPLTIETVPIDLNIKPQIVKPDINEPEFIPEIIDINTTNDINNVKTASKHQPININITHNDPYSNLNNGTKPSYSTWPHSILKNGTRPTYRTWNKTQKFQQLNENKLTSISERERKLNDLKEKIQEKHKNINDIEIDDYTPKKELSYPFNRKTIKTTKKKYTLGKSISNRHVSILIKSNKTRKIIIDACKDLKRQSINEVKKYLKKHNLIKSGSNAPNNILRKLYESAMTTGEITNYNRETLMDNFLKSE